MKTLVAVIGLLWGGGMVAAQDYNPQDFLPLAVGNSWTYTHRYTNDIPYIVAIPGYETIEDKVDTYPPDSLLFTSQSNVTVRITHTEQIDGHLYYVFSGVNYSWPPVPEFFLAGKKVRWDEDGRLVELWHGMETAFFDLSDQTVDIVEPEVQYDIPAVDGFEHVKGNLYISGSRPKWEFSFHRDTGIEVFGWVEFLNRVGITSVYMGFTRTDYSEYRSWVAGGSDEFG